MRSCEDLQTLAAIHSVEQRVACLRRIVILTLRILGGTGLCFELTRFWMRVLRKSLVPCVRG